MSRFYDALKEAGRSTGVPGGTPLRDESDANEPLANEVPVQAAVAELSGSSAGPERDTPEPQPEDLHTDLLNLAGIRPAVAASGVPHLHNGEQKGGSALSEEHAPSLRQAPAIEGPDSTDDLKRQKSPAAAGIFQAKNEIVFDPGARLIPEAVDSVVVEHYRRLRTKILQQHAVKPFQILMVSSPSPQEGKTVTVLNLGLSFAMLPNFKVLVVDGDLRKGTIGKWLGADNYPGLSNVLESAANLEEVAIKCSNVSMHVVTRGNSKTSPAELLHSPRLNAEFRRMTEHFDLVLVDSPPVTLITDAQLLAGSCDAVLLIARAFKTRRKSLEQASQDLSAFRVIGTVLNGGTSTQLDRAYGGYY
jgi:capsular exopolysaccharide synthesis family protein